MNNFGIYIRRLEPSFLKKENYRLRVLKEVQLESSFFCCGINIYFLIEHFDLMSVRCLDGGRVLDLKRGFLLPGRPYPCVAWLSPCYPIVLFRVQIGGASFA